MRSMRIVKSRSMGLFAAAVLVGLISAPASADDPDKNSPEPPAVAECVGDADVWHVDQPYGTQVQNKEGITFPVTTDPAQAQAARDFAWRLTTTCDIVGADGDIIDTGDLEVSGWANGWCGSSTATPNPDEDNQHSETLDTAASDEINNNWGTFTQTNGDWEVNLWDISWESAGSVLAVDFQHDAGADKKPESGPGAAEVDAIGGDPCATNNGATSFSVVIAAELLP